MTTKWCFNDGRLRLGGGQQCPSWSPGLLARATLATYPRGLLTVDTGAGGNCTALVGGARCAACEKVAVAAPTAGRE